MASLLNRWSALPVAALLITACGGGSASTTQPAQQTSAIRSTKPKPTATKPPNDSEQLNKLLIVRGDALEAKDAAGYAGTATGAQVATDKRAIGRTVGLPLGHVRMMARGTEINGKKATMRVDLVYTFDGIDTEYVKTSRMSAQKTDKGWKVSADRPSDGALAPWEYDDLQAARRASTSSPSRPGP